MSQWIELSFVPPMNVYELPSARWIVPSIFSSNADVLHEALDARVAADAELAEPARALVGVERLDQELLARRAPTRRRRGRPRRRAGRPRPRVPKYTAGNSPNSITPFAESSTGE